MRFFFLGLSVVLVSAVASEARAETYRVGPGQTYAQLTEIEGMLAPGDVVEVMGDATYQGGIHIRPESSGTPDQKVTIRGVPVNGKRPVISGGSEFGITLNGSHTIFEGFEVTGAPRFCVVHKADDVTIRDSIVHDCPNHGILGTDSESGSLTIEYTEVYNCGEGSSRHQLYIATDETMYPGSVFRLQYSYIHDNAGGNLVKSRSERNEIYYNWLETGANGYHAMDLIGPDGQDEGIAREDSDVVGNVIVQVGDWQIARIGGDGTGQTNGHYRFAYNTILIPGGGEPMFRLQDGIGSITVENNVFLYTGGGGARLISDSDASFANGRAVHGAGNWASDGLEIPDDITGTIFGSAPGFVDLAGHNLVPADGSPLIDQGAPLSNLPIPNPLVEPQMLPPARRLEAVGSAAQRGLGGSAPDLGAYEFGAVIMPGMTTAATGAGAGTGGGNTDDGGAGGNGNGSEVEDDGGCGCRTSAPTSTHVGGAWLVALAAGAVLRRVRDRRTSRG